MISILKNATNLLKKIWDEVKVPIRKKIKEIVVENKKEKKKFVFFM